jgi:8-hydroxy-5-deazaflavin:NADPH oxidoreductase
MRIGILGSGQVGQSLARGFARHGHETRIGTRQAEVGDFPVGTPAEVAGWAELVFLAVSGSAAVRVVTEVAGRLDGKVLVDATNPLDFSSGAPQLFVGHTDSLGEQVQRAAPGAQVVKAYNTVGNALFVDPDLPGGPPTMCLAGDSAEAKATVGGLLHSTGWDSADLGGIDSSRFLEPMCMAWVRYGGITGDWGHAFKLLRPA